MILDCIALLVGFLVLFKSADHFVIGSVAVARNFSVSPMIIGLTIASLGTSAPEIFIAATSSLEQQPELAVGNAIGSNIANLGMVLGITTLIVPLKFRREILYDDMPILVFVTLCAGVTLLNYQLGIWDGLLLITVLGLFLYRLATRHRQSASPVPGAEFSIHTELQELPPTSNRRAISTLLLSLALLLVSAELLVWSASSIAGRLGVSELIIGLTIIAVGTSLPELVVSITSALKGQSDIAIGNIMGSNIFNILAAFAIPCILAPTSVDELLLSRDYVAMLLLTLMLVVFSCGVGGGQASIGRYQGGLLLSLWIGYLVVLYYSAMG